jgi:hypothetical protein
MSEKSGVSVYAIIYDELSKYVTMTWEGYATSSEFREGTELMLNTLIQNKCSKVLADVSKMVLISREDQLWLETNFLPRANRFGFTKIALIQPTSYFNKVAIETINSRIDKKKISLMVFENGEEAKHWLIND